MIDERWNEAWGVGIGPEEREDVLVRLSASADGSMPASVVVGYLRFAAGCRLSPYFVTPGISQRGRAVLGWKRFRSDFSSETEENFDGSPINGETLDERRRYAQRREHDDRPTPPERINVTKVFDGYDDRLTIVQYEDGSWQYRLSDPADPLVRLSDVERVYREVRTPPPGMCGGGDDLIWKARNEEHIQGFLRRLTTRAAAKEKTSG